MRMFITLTMACRPGADEMKYQQEKHRVKDFEQAEKLLMQSYALIPRMRRRRGVYIDQPDGQALQVGIMICQWFRSWGETKSWWRSAWVTFQNEDGSAVDLPKKYRAKI